MGPRQSGTGGRRVWQGWLNQEGLEKEDDAKCSWFADRRELQHLFINKNELGLDLDIFKIKREKVEKKVLMNNIRMSEKETSMTYLSLF